MEVFKNFKVYAPLRRAIAQIVGRSENVMETWHKFEALKDPLNMVCGYDESDNSMREVDVLMMESAFETKLGQICIPYEDVDGECENGKDRFIHLNIGSDGKVTQIACSQSNDKDHSHSVAMEPCCYFPMDSVIPAVMHVRLGVARSLLDFDFDFYGKIAELAEGGNHEESRHAIEETIQHLEIYLEELDFAQADVLESLEGRDKQEQSLLDRMEAARKVVEAESLAEETREKWRRILEEVEREYEILVDGDDAETPDDKLLKKQMLEQSCMVKNTIDELQRIHKKYSCFSQVIIVDTLKEFNVDLQVYFNGVIVGPHCMILAKNAEKIQGHLYDEMMKKVKEPSLREAMKKYRDKMVAIYKVWYELCKTMMSTKEQDDAAIQKFEDNIKELKRQIHNLIVVDPPLSGDKNPLQLPTKLKWFTLLSDVLVNTLKLWRCIGDVAEESIESFHPRRNKMSRRYCQVRGKRRNELIMKALQFESASWIWEGIKAMLKATKSKRAKVVRTQQPTAVEEAPQEEENEEQEEEEEEEEELLDWELQMNECPSLRVQDDFEHEDEALRSAYMKMDTRIHICCGCRQRFIGERALKIHQNERHKIKSEETDAVDGTVR